MSFLSAFLTNHLISMLESSLLTQEPIIQEAFLNEVKELTEQVDTWLKSKLTSKAS